MSRPRDYHRMWDNLRTTVIQAQYRAERERKYYDAEIYRRFVQAIANVERFEDFRNGDKNE